MNEQKMGPREMRAEIIRLHHENLMPTLERFAGSDCGNASRVSGENSLSTSVQKEGVIVRCLFKAHIESNPILRVLACPQQKCDVLAFPHQCLQ
jgi:hypothetical protein